MISVTERITESRNGSSSVPQPGALTAAGGGDRVVAAGAAVGVLPVALDHLVGLELAQQRVDRVRVDRDHALGDPLDLLDQPVAVLRLALDQVQDEQREEVAAADLAAEDVHRSACSVTERTREIGAQLAVGARASDVLTQFLVEATVLSLSGGLFGVGLAAAIAALLSRLTSLNTPFNPTMAILAFAFSGAVGVFFGFYPARKAAALDPIEALRYE